MLKFTSYEDLINFAKSQTRTKGSYVYYEAHHVVPKHMGGTNDKSNIVLLTLYEHLLAHYLLALKYESIDKREFFANLAACGYILSGCSKHFQTLEAKEYLQNILADPDCKELQERIAEKNKKREPPIKGKCFVMKGSIRKLIKQSDLKAYEKRGWVKQVSEFTWVQFRNQKPVKCSSKSLQKKFKDGFKIFNSCPVCGGQNSYESWCCCEKCENIFEKNRKKLKSDTASENLKKEWAQENSVRKTMKKTYKSHKGEKIWVYKGEETKRVKSSEENKYKELGYKRGRTREFVEKIVKEKKKFEPVYNQGEVVTENNFSQVQCRQKYFIICFDCKKKVSKIKRNAFQIFSPYCTICGRKYTNLKKYGGVAPACSKEIQEKMKQTCLEKYGTEYLMQNEQLKEKSKITKSKTN